MGAKSIRSKHDNRVSRAKILKLKRTSLFDMHPDTTPAQINTKESICKKCGFKARYQFIRCPECNRLHEE